MDFFMPFLAEGSYCVGICNIEKWKDQGERVDAELQFMV